MHRSQKDPLAADEDAPQRVLVPIASKVDRSNTGDGPSSSKVICSKISYYILGQDLQYLSQDLVKQKEEQIKFGIFYDDDYDYLQHLKDVSQTVEWELAEDSKNSRLWKAPVAKGISVRMSDTCLIGAFFILFGDCLLIGSS